MFFVTAYFGQPHGSAKSARDFARALLAVHDYVHIVSPLTEEFGAVVAGRDLAVPVWHRYPRRDGRRTIWRRLLSSVRDGFRRPAICYAMVGHLIVVNGWASYGYWKTLKATGYKQSAIIVRESPRHFDGNDRPNILEHMLAAFAEFDRLIFVSERLRKEWGQFAELADKPSFYLPNCCEEEEVARVKQSDRQEMRQRLGMGRDDLVVICPGTIEIRKGQDIILDVWREVLGTIPQARLILLGDGGTAWGKAMAADVDGGKYGARVSHIPSQPSALEFLHAADVLLFPSRAEAMPRTLLEGMALGMPILAASVDGVPELIEDGVSGWLFDHGNQRRMIQRLCYIADHKEVALKLGLSAEIRYKTQFSRKRQIARVGVLLNWLNVG